MCAVRAVRHDDESLAPVRIAGTARAEYSRRNAITHAFQWAAECFELLRSVPRDVFTEDTIRPHGVHDGQDVIGKEPFVIGSEPLSRDAVALARIAGSDAMNASTPACAVECGKVAPDRCRMKPPRIHRRDQRSGRSGFPLHVTDPAHIASAKMLAKHDAEFEASDACAQPDDGGDGT